MSHDRAHFEQLLGELEARADARRPKPFDRALFDRKRPLVVARAPGRLDVMGGFADYSGSLALELPTREAAFVAVQEVDEPIVRVQSSSFGPEASPEREAAFPLQELREHTRSYGAAHAYFRSQPSRGWTAYVAGVLAALNVELGREIDGGLHILVASSVPEGKGVSSSAAIEVATFHALAALYGVDVPAARAAIYCQRVENLVVGAPCGVMDQMTSSCGHEGQLLPLLCQPAELLPGFSIPAGLAIWGIDSGLRHQVSGADYTQVRVAAFMGYAMIARALGFAITPGPEPGRVVIRDEVYRGYLANITPESFEREHRARLPDRMSGAEFLRELGGVNDPITRVDPGVLYRVRAATAHPIYEHRRASEYSALMQSGRGRAAGGRLGELMYEAHDSYSACGLGSAGTDRIVALVRERGAAHGLYGAKITGGGSGGTVAVLGESGARPAIDNVMSTYAKESGHSPHLFWGSSPGAAELGAVRAHWEGGWHLGAPSQAPALRTKGAS